MADHPETWEYQYINLWMSKNQNKCWKRTGSPPVCASKNAVPKFLSVKSIVIAPAKTGKDNNNKKAVTRIDHENKGILCKVIPGALILSIVVIKFIAPKIEEAPATCKLKIAKSIAGPGCPVFDDKGG